MQNNSINSIVEKYYRKTKYSAWIKKVILKTFIIIPIILSGSNSYAQEVIKGLLLNKKRQAIPNVSIHIKGENSDIKTDENGIFEIETSAEQTLTLTFHHLFYKPKTIQIHSFSTGNIIYLDDETYGVPLNLIETNPAYNIVRKAIALAPLYRNQLIGYTSDIQTKGMLRIIYLSSLLRSIIKKNDLEFKIREGDVFLKESINEVNYMNNKYTLNEKIVTNTFPKEFDLKLPVINYNVYEDNNQFISPLSPHAFFYYNFVYEGASVEGRHTINKIRVIPKKIKTRALSGYLYISNDYWNVHKLELENDNMGVKTLYRQTYEELENNILGLSSNRIDFDISLIGNKMNASFESIIKYRNYIADNNIKNDLIKNGVGDNQQYTDSIKWTPIKPDNIDAQQWNDFMNQFSSLKKKPIMIGLLMGNTYRKDSTLRIKYGGLVNPAQVGYNLVDGWSFKQTLDLKKNIGNFGDFRNIQSEMTALYAFNRNRFMFDIGSRYFYSPSKGGIFSLKTGIFSTDFNYMSGINKFDNEISTLFFRKNIINFFENKYFTVNNTIDITNNITTFIEFDYHSREQLNNITNYSVLYKDSRKFRPNTPTQNIPVMMQLMKNNNSYVANHKAANITLEVSYTPQKYHIEKNNKLNNVISKYPTFTFLWRKGIENVFQSDSDFDQVELSVFQSFKFNILGSFNYLITGGFFPRNKFVHFSDFKHFNIKESNLLFDSFDKSYNLLTTYQPSTNKWYCSAFAQFSAPHIFLKYLPILNKTMFQENLYLSYLSTEYIKNYTELGYAFTNIGVFLGIGTFIGFENLKHKNVGFKVSFNIADIMNTIH